MNIDHLSYLACPACKGDFALEGEQYSSPGMIETGTLTCRICSARYDIVGHIPRFVSSENYARNFGFEWKTHARTQYDSVSGRSISKDRFIQETRWSQDLAGEVLLEVGSGSGRFTEHAAATGAMIISLDYSAAVEANYASNGTKPNVLIVQGDIYRMPVREQGFDKVLCIGVLQHTPDVRKAFMSLIPCLKPGGTLVIDVYARRSGLAGLLERLRKTRYWVRPLTRHMQPEKLYRRCEQYIHLMWPLASVLRRIPKLGSRINWFLLIPDYRAQYDLPDQVAKEWAILDLFDILSPAFDQPQTIETVRDWFGAAGLSEVEVCYGHNGIEGRGKRASGA